MISAFLREFVLPILLFLVLRKLLAGLFSGGRRAMKPSQPPPTRPGGTLYKDPVCGTYVSSDSALTLTLNGQTTYFCSRECLDKYHER